MTSDQVTVVIPTRNRLDYLQQAVASVEAQTIQGWRVLVIDDASDDDTWTWIEQRTGPKVRGIRNDARFERSVCRNSGLSETETPFILFLDDDDRLRPDALERLVDGLLESPEAVAAVGGLAYFDDMGNRQPVPHPKKELKRDVWPDAVYGWVAHTGRTVFRASFVRNADGFQPGLVVAEDRDLWLRISRLGPVVFVPGTVLDHRMHPGQWRPLNVHDTELAVTRRHLAMVSVDERRLGERILEARPHILDGKRAWDEDRPHDAVRQLVQLRRAPAVLLFSPFVRRDWIKPFWRALIGSLLGTRGIRLSRRALARVRRRGATDEAWDVPFPMPKAESER